MRQVPYLTMTNWSVLISTPPPRYEAGFAPLHRFEESWALGASNTRRTFQGAASTHAEGPNTKQKGRDANIHMAQGERALWWRTVPLSALASPLPASVVAPNRATTPPRLPFPCPLPAVMRQRLSRDLFSGVVEALVAGSPQLNGVEWDCVVLVSSRCEGVGCTRRGDALHATQWL